MSKLREQVSAFHQAFGAPVLGVPQVPAAERVDLRLRLVGEEFCELLEACGCDEPLVEDLWGEIRKLIRLRKSNAVDIVAVADACGDLDFVVEGTRLEFGINGDPIADEIARSNLSKVGSTIAPGGKIQKGPNYSPPEIERLLREQGWTGPEGTEAA